MNKPKMKVFRIMLGKPEYSHFKTVAHYQQKEDAMKAAQFLQLHAGKYTRYHVDSVEVY